MDDLATVWCEWAEMELRHKNFKRALDLMRRATVPPVRAGPRRSQEEMQGPVQGRLYRRCGAASPENAVLAVRHSTFALGQQLDREGEFEWRHASLKHSPFASTSSRW